jgi:(2Fe-2S) ferredoxin
MSEENTGYQCHVFVCTNQPDNPSKCGSKGSESLRKELKEKCAQAFGKAVRVNASGCLGYCEHGIAAVLYPQGQWLLDLNKDSGNKIFQEVSETIRIIDGSV